MTSCMDRKIKASQILGQARRGVDVLPSPACSLRVPGIHPPFLIPGAMSSPSALSDHEGEAPPVAQIEVRGADCGEDDSFLGGVDSVLGAISVKSVGSLGAYSYEHEYAAGKRATEECKNDGDSQISEKTRSPVLNGGVKSDSSGSDRKKRKTGGVTNVVNKAIRESFKKALESIKSAGEEPSLEHPAIQTIMTDHNLKDGQTNYQISNWINGEVHSALVKIETAGEVPSINHPEIQQIKERYKYLTHDRLTRAFEKWEKQKQQQSCQPSPAVASVAVAKSTEAPLYACIRKKDNKFSVEDIDGPFPEHESPDFGENVVWAINYLHEKGYSYVADEEQTRMKNMLNRKRDMTDEFPKKEPLTLCIFSKDSNALKAEPAVICRPKLVVLYLERVPSKTCETNKEGKAYLQGSEDEPFAQGPFESVGKVMKEALRLGYKRMKETKEKHWIKLIDYFVAVEDGLDHIGFPDKILNGLYDEIIGIYEK